jgi:[ribosomal protein S18]-alanine N-acetyltransferase
MVNSPRTPTIIEGHQHSFGCVLATLHKDSVDFGAWSAKSYEQLLKQPAVSSLIIVEGDKPIGFLLFSATKYEAEILMLCIHPAYRRLSFAGQLLRSFIAKLRDLNISDLLLEVAENNENALKLYGNFGFEKVGERSSYYESSDGKKISATILKRIIT